MVQVPAKLIPQKTVVPRERKNMNLPGVKVDLPVITEKDERDLLEFACRQPVDFIAASFVTKASDIRVIRKTLGPRARSIKIIAKIENQEGLENYDEILAETDGVMVARGGGCLILFLLLFLYHSCSLNKCTIKTWEWKSLQKKYFSRKR